MKLAEERSEGGDEEETPLVLEKYFPDGNLKNKIRIDLDDRSFLNKE